MFRFLKRLFGLGGLPAGIGLTSTQPEQALIIDTRELSVSLDEVLALEDALTEALEASGVGDVDGHDIAVDGSHAIIYMYGAEANKMLVSTLTVLRAHRISASGFARLRFGAANDPSVQEIYVEICKIENP